MQQSIFLTFLFLLCQINTNNLVTCILLAISSLLFFLSLFKTPVDKCGVSRLISGVDTIKIEDSVNTRPGKLYKVNSY